MKTSTVIILAMYVTFACFFASVSASPVDTQNETKLNRETRRGGSKGGGFGDCFGGRGFGGWRGYGLGYGSWGGYGGS
jgi:hypothetical protein